MNPLHVDTARKRFGTIDALDGVTLTLGPGELLALLGPNGAGKTTLVRAIAGRVRLDAGRIELAGREGHPARRNLGLVPQEVALYPLLTARENLEVFGKLNGLAGAALRQAVSWALGWTGLEARAGDQARTYSGGMKRRLNLACGVLHRPGVVLLDEPTVGVDPQSREKIYEMLAQLRGQGASLLLTTHQLDEAEGRCDRVVIIDHGKVVAAGTVGELVARCFGGSHTVALTLDPEPVGPVPGCEMSPGSRVVRTMVENVTTELPGLLARISSAGFQVEDLEMRRPGLGAVFLKLTGRDLRE